MSLLRRRAWAVCLALCACEGPPDGHDAGAPPTQGMVGPMGGSVTQLYFAVIGDTRPANPDDTAGYPTTIIEKIYADVAALDPRPQFVIATGDYMFASVTRTEAQPQIALYMHAAQQFTGPIFAAMGNHECTGATASDCSGTITNNLTAYLDALVRPLGFTQPYYTIPVDDLAGAWTAKIIIVACNAWSPTQAAWFEAELASPTTYTYVVRHEPTGTRGPLCVPEMDALMKNARYDLFIVGHSHTFRHRNKELTVGNGGAPITDGTSYGFATVRQQTSNLVVTEYDYLTSMPVDSFTVP